MRFLLADRTARPLGRKELDKFLAGPNILRLAIIDERDGWPIVHPVWYHYKAGKFLIATDRTGVKARSLRKNPHVYFLVDVSPDDGPPMGVRGKGLAKVIDDPDYAVKLTKQNIIRYMGTIETEKAKEVMELGKSSSVVEVKPVYMATWKF